MNSSSQQFVPKKNKRGKTKKKSSVLKEEKLDDLVKLPTKKIDPMEESRPEVVLNSHQVISSGSSRSHSDVMAQSNPNQINDIQIDSQLHIEEQPSVRIELPEHLSEDFKKPKIKHFPQGNLQYPESAEVSMMRDLQAPNSDMMIQSHNETLRFKPSPIISINNLESTAQLDQKSKSQQIIEPQVEIQEKNEEKSQKKPEKLEECDIVQQQEQKDLKKKKVLRVIFGIFIVVLVLACLGVVSSVFSLEGPGLDRKNYDKGQMESVLKMGQENNIVQLKYMPGDLYTYSYAISQEQSNFDEGFGEKETRRRRNLDSNDENGEQNIKNVVNSEFQVQILCDKVTENLIEFFVVFQNYSKSFGDCNSSDCRFESQEYPLKKGLNRRFLEKSQDQTPINLQKNNKGEEINLDSILFHMNSNDQISLESTNNNNSDLYDRGESMEDIQYQNYIESYTPIIHVSIFKNGTVHEIQRPLHLQQQYMNIIPQLLKQFSPVLLKNVYAQGYKGTDKQIQGDMQSEHKIVNQKDDQVEILKVSNTFQNSYSEKNSDLISNFIIKDGILEQTSSISNLQIESGKNTRDVSEIDSMLGNLDVVSESVLQIKGKNFGGNTDIMEQIQDQFQSITLIKENFISFIADLGQKCQKKIQQYQEQKILEDENGKNVNFSQYSDIIKEQNLIFDPKIIPIVSQNLAGKGSTLQVRLTCYKNLQKSQETEGKLDKDICLLQLQLNIFGNLRNLGQAKILSIDLSQGLKVMNYYLQKIQEETKKLIQNSEKNFQDLEEYMNVSLSEIKDLINPEKNDQIFEKLTQNSEKMAQSSQNLYKDVNENVKKEEIEINQNVQNLLTFVFSFFSDKNSEFQDAFQENMNKFNTNLQEQLEILEQILKDKKDQFYQSDYEYLLLFKQQVKDTTLLILEKLEGNAQFYDSSLKNQINEFFKDQIKISHSESQDFQNFVNGVLEIHMEKVVDDNFKSYQENTLQELENVHIQMLETMGEIQEKFEIEFENIEQVFNQTEKVAGNSQDNSGFSQIIEDLVQQVNGNSKKLTEVDSFLFEQFIEDGSNIEQTGKIIENYQRFSENFVNLSSDLNKILNKSVQEFQLQINVIQKNITDVLGDIQDNLTILYSEIQEDFFTSLGVFSESFVGFSDKKEISKVLNDIVKKVQDIVESPFFKNMRSKSEEILELDGQFKNLLRDVQDFLFTGLEGQDIKLGGFDNDLFLEFSGIPELKEIVEQIIKDKFYEQDLNQNDQIQQIKELGELSLELGEGTKSFLQEEFLLEINSFLNNNNENDENGDIKNSDRYQGEKDFGKGFKEKISMTENILTPLGTEINIGVLMDIDINPVFSYQFEENSLFLQLAMNIDIDFASWKGDKQKYLRSKGAYAMGKLLDGNLTISLEGELGETFNGSISSKIDKNPNTIKLGIFNQNISTLKSVKCFNSQRNLQQLNYKQNCQHSNKQVIQPSKQRKRGQGDKICIPQFEQQYSDAVDVIQPVEIEGIKESRILMDESL